MLCIFTMSSLHSLKDGQDPVVADPAVESVEWKWWLESSGPPSHSYLQRPGKYSGWELMNSRKWRQVTKSLPGLWADAYIQRGKNIKVTEVISDDYTEYVVEIEDGDRYTRYRNIPGYSAKGIIFDELLGIEDYQRYTTVVCQATPIWDTIIRLCRSKGLTVTRVTDGWTFES